MPNTNTATKPAKLHPGRDAGNRPGPSTGDDRPTPIHSGAGEPGDSQGPRTSFSGEPLCYAVEDALHTLLDLGGAREDIAFDIDRRDDLMSPEQRQRAVADLERIIGELAGGLARARRGRQVAILVELVEQPQRARPGRDEPGLRTAV